MYSEYSRKPTVAQIQRTLRLIPVLQREQVIASMWAGTRVEWQARFLDAIDIGIVGGPIKQLVFTPRGTSRLSRTAAIITRIDIDEHPETRTLIKGRRVNLFGTVMAVDLLSITLQIDRFEILGASFFDRFL